MDDTLYAAACAGHLVLTVNDRLSRHLSGACDAERRQGGGSAWLRPDILSLAAWLSRQQERLPGLPPFLTRAQLQYSWERVVEQDVDITGNRLLDIPQTARRALQAHQLLVRYAADFDAREAAEDHRAFLRWRSSWLAAAAVRGWRDPAELPWLLADLVADGGVPLPREVWFAGFDEIPPDLERLRSAMSVAGARVVDWQPQPIAQVNRRLVRGEDAADEVRRCARWARAILSAEPSARIGVVAPQLESYRTLVEHHFLAELEPGRLVAADESPSLFNLSLGQPLAREEVVGAALRLLRVGPTLDQEEVSWILLAPYLDRAETEGESRAQLDRELRRLRRFTWPLQRLGRTCKDLGDKYALQAPGLFAVFDTLAAEVQRGGRRLPGQWAEYFTTLLHRLGWPGERGLSSREFQAVGQFRELLGVLASLDGVAAPLTRAEAVTLLARAVGESEFQPEGDAGPVQVLGELESGGMTFDHLWVLGLHSAALPSRPSPNPFVPLPVQRRHGMRRADAEREFRFASQVATRLFSAAQEVVLSWPAQAQGVEQRPSPFLYGVGEGDVKLAVACAPDRAIWQARETLEPIDDRRGPPLNTRRPFTGGTGILKDQALCPFRAFAHHRLRAERLEAPDIGLDGLSRGTLAHAVLEYFWEEVGSRDALLALDEERCAFLVDAAVAKALERFERERRHDLPPRQRRIEAQRLVRLARCWLEVEQRRGWFRLFAAEKSTQVQAGALTIRTRIDRIDELADGTLAIIDYKTGSPDPLQWLEERIVEPQLPAYCLGLPREKVGAVLFAVVRGKEKEAGFRGLARDAEAWPKLSSSTVAARLAEQGWDSFDAVLDHWTAALAGLGDAFAGGEAAVDPVDAEVACKYCDLGVLCRVLESGAGPAGEGGDHE